MLRLRNRTIFQIRALRYYTTPTDPNVSDDISKSVNIAEEHRDWNGDDPFVTEEQRQTEKERHYGNAVE